MVSRGAFILHDAVRPAVPDGAYEINVTQRLDPPDQSVDALDKHIAITGPRFTLPPDQALTIYPPANSSGAFSTRLPQIVLRRRTLPWERYIDAGDPTLPWLALVVVADGEGQLTTGQPVDTTGLPDPELRDSDTRDILTVSGTVVKQIFPTKQDLPWLCHVREVDLTDTELAGRPFTEIQRLEHETDWIHCRVRDGKFEGHGGPFMLEEILRVFLAWATVSQTV